MRTVRLNKGVNLALLVLVARPVVAQAEAVAPRNGLPAPESYAQPAVQRSLAHLSTDASTQQDGGQVEAFKQEIINPDATAETRRVSARFLLMSTEPAAAAAAVEILRDATRPFAQTAICEAAIELGTTSPDALTVELVEPLVTLLRTAGEAQQRLAAHALGLYRDGDVASRLGSVAQDATLPESARLAAIGALAINMTRREVVEQLILLLDDPTPAIVSQSLDVLQPASREARGRDVASWKAWWSGKAALSETEWLADRNALLLQRTATLTQQRDRAEAEAKTRESRLSARVAELQRDLFRRLPPDERDGKLIAWLADEIPGVRRTAIDLVMRPISEEARRPSAPVRAALSERLRDPVADVRRGALEIFGAMADPADADAVMALLNSEADAATRQAAFEALGRMRNAAAFPLLVREIADDAAAVACVRSAADAITRLVAIASVPIETAATAVEPLKRRYAAVAAEDAATRAALLGAMAELARPDFVEEYRLVVAGSREPALLRPALRGLTGLVDKQSIGPVRAVLQASDDALVRQRCIEMIAAAGGDETDVAALVRYAQTANESTAAVRDAALQTLTAWMAPRAGDEQLRIADRLASDPAAMESYLTLLVHRLSQGGGNGATALEIRRRLAETLAAAGKHGPAAAQYRALFDGVAAAGGEGVCEVGTLLILTSLRAGEYDTLPAAVNALRPHAETDTFDRLADDLKTYLESIDAAAEPGRVSNTRKAILGVTRDGLGERWQELAETLEKEHADQPPVEPSPESPAPTGVDEEA